MNATQPLHAPSRDTSPVLSNLLSVLAGASSPQEGGRMIMAELREQVGSHFNARMQVFAPRAEVVGQLEAEVEFLANDVSLTATWYDGDRELGNLQVVGLEPHERLMVESWTPWLQPAVKRLVDARIELERAAHAARQALIWQIKAELLALAAEGPQPARTFVNAAVDTVMRLIDARQIVFWSYSAKEDSLDASHVVGSNGLLGIPAVPRGLFQEVVQSRHVRTVAIAGSQPSVFVLGPVFTPQGLAGVLQVVLAEAVLGGSAEEEVAAAADALGAGLTTVTTFEKLAYQASHDALTGLANRRTFQAQLDREVKLARRHGTALSLVVVDVDHFKRYNDSFGHAAGDALLMAIANALAGAARTTDFVARFGGEEFVVLLPHTDREGALVAAHKLLEAIRAVHETAVVLSGQVTASIGVATLGAQDAEHLFEAADQAMYQAKQTGRNQVCQI